jgi:RNA polymerase sigma-70 factor (ECF subfamily)
MLERFRSGDATAFEELFAKYRPRLAVLIHYKLGPELRRTMEVDDVLQEVFLVASRDLNRFVYRSPGSFMSWLARIADHVLVDAARSQGRLKRHAAEMLRFRSASNPGGPEPTDLQTPSRIFAQQEGLQRLLDRLDALPEDYRQVILLARIEGLATADIADRMGKSREAVAVLLHRAVHRFRELQEQKNQT